MKIPYQPSLRAGDESLIGARLRAAEFFAGIGLIRQAIEAEGFSVVFANDIEVKKKSLYEANFGASEFLLGDVRNVTGSDIPEIDLATASFPCTDLSLAGNRAGLGGLESGLFWEFARIIKEMKHRPNVILLENVPGLATSNAGADLHSVLKKLNTLGYCCDVFLADASWFVPQSRLRLFVVGSRERVEPANLHASAIRPSRLMSLLKEFRGIRLQTKDLSKPLVSTKSLSDIAERLDPGDLRWWDRQGTTAFIQSLSSLQEARLADLMEAPSMSWVAAYRRTRAGKAVWEIRPDFISGCLRTARGGSSRQAILEVGRGLLHVRWMTPREYARLQGVPDAFRLDVVTRSQALFGLGDAVCVPVIRWIAKSYLRPLAEDLCSRQDEVTVPASNG